MLSTIVGRSMKAAEKWLLVILASVPLLFQLNCKPPRPEHATAAKSSISEFIHTQADSIALTHVHVIDGTGAPGRKDQTIIIERGRIKSIGRSVDIAIPPDAKILDLREHTVIPGLVGMNDPMFYAANGGADYLTMDFSFPRLYLACGVTTLRTGDVISVERDLAIKKLIDDGMEPGPRIYLTATYVVTSGSEEDIARANGQVENWIKQGVRSIKVGHNSRRKELSAAVELAHRNGCKVTGELCAVGFSDAAELGVDDLQHGLLSDAEFYERKLPDICPGWETAVEGVYGLDVNSGRVHQLINSLVSHRVAITSTLPVFEMLAGNPFQYDPRMKNVLSLDAFESLLEQRAKSKQRTTWAWQVLFKKEMQFERNFVKGGGLLLLGVDPTAWGGVIAGFGDQRAIELLVDAGFTPEQAIRIATANGAQYLGESNDIGTITAGKRADLVVLRGDPPKRISDIRNVEIVFKDGIGFDSAKLIASVRGQVGKR